MANDAKKEAPRIVSPTEVNVKENLDKQKKKKAAGAVMVGVGSAAVAGVPMAAVGGAAVAGLVGREVFRRARELEQSHHEMSDDARQQLEKYGLLADSRHVQGTAQYLGAGLKRLFSSNKEIGRLVGSEITDQMKDDAEAMQLVKIAEKVAQLDFDQAVELQATIIEGNHLEDMPMEALAQAVFFSEMKADYVAASLEDNRAVRQSLGNKRVESWKKSKAEMQAMANQNPERYAKLMQEQNERQWIVSELDEVQRIFDADESELTPNEVAIFEAYLSKADAALGKQSFKETLNLGGAWETRELRVAAEARAMMMQDKLSGRYDQERADYLTQNSESYVQRALTVQNSLGNLGRITSLRNELQQVAGDPDRETQIRAEIEELSHEMMTGLASGSLETYVDQSYQEAQARLRQLEEENFEAIMEARERLARTGGPDQNAINEVLAQMPPEFAAAYSRGGRIDEALQRINANPNEAEQIITDEINRLDTILGSLNYEQTYNDSRTRQGRGGNPYTVSDSQLKKESTLMARYIELRDRKKELESTVTLLQAHETSDAVKYLRKLKREDEETVSMYKDTFEASLREREAIAFPVTEDEIAQAVGGEYQETIEQLKYLRLLDEQLLQQSARLSEPGESVIDSRILEANIDIAGQQRSIVDVLGICTNIDVRRGLDKAAEFSRRAHYIQERNANPDGPQMYDEALRLRSEIDKIQAEIRNKGGNIKEVGNSFNELILDANRGLETVLTDSQKNFNSDKLAYKKNEQSIRALTSELLYSRAVANEGKETLKKIYGEDQHGRDIFERMEISKSMLKRTASEKLKVEKLMKKMASGEGVSKEEQEYIDKWIKDKRHEKLAQAEMAESDESADRKELLYEMAQGMGIDTDAWTPEQVDNFMQKTQHEGFFGYLMAMLEFLFTGKKPEKA